MIFLKGLPHELSVSETDHYSRTDKMLLYSAYKLSSTFNFVYKMKVSKCQSNLYVTPRIIGTGIDNYSSKIGLVLLRKNIWNCNSPTTINKVYTFRYTSTYSFSQQPAGTVVFLYCSPLPLPLQSSCLQTVALYSTLPLKYQLLFTLKKITITQVFRRENFCWTEKWNFVKDAAKRTNLSLMSRW